MTYVKVNKLHTLTGHNDCVYSLEPAELPEQFFSAAGDGMVALWNMQQPDLGKLVAKLPNSIYALHYHQVSGYLIVGHNYEGIHVIDWKQNKELASLKISPSAIFDIKSHGNTIFIASGDGTVHLLDLANMKLLTQLKLSDKSARTIAINTRLNEMAVGYSDHIIRIFNLNDLQLKKEIASHTNSVFSLLYSPDGEQLLSAARDARIKLWDAAGGYQLLNEVVAHMYAINHLQFSADGKHFVTCSMDKSIKVWNAAAMKLLKVIDRARHAGHGTSVNKLYWSAYNNYLVSASDDRHISLWDIQFNDQITHTV
jgi:WD40 repeat protein